MAHNQVGPCIELERSLPSEVAAISPFVDRLMLLFRKCGCVSEGGGDVEIALREALANAIIHGNHENPGKHVHVRCRCEPSEISIAVKDEGRGFDANKVADPTAPENTGSVHGRGIYLMKALMDEVRFEERWGCRSYAKERRPSCSQRCTDELAGVGLFPVSIRNPCNSRIQHYFVSELLLWCYHGRMNSQKDRWSTFSLRH
jgi:anti-sigma regulatory factor (Ser/Thr protein kinase)